MRIVFMGTSSFAIPSLARIVKAGYEVPLVVTQPDRPKGRGLNIAPSEIKSLALRLGISVFQPPKISTKESIAYIQGVLPDTIVVVAYGQILPSKILNIPKFGCINLHPSLLPKLRGPAPIQWAIMLGKESSGVTTIFMDEGMDTGDIILKEETKILEEDTFLDLSQRLSIIGADLLIKTLRLLEKGAPRSKQDGSIATYAPPITKKDAIIDWKRSAVDIHNLIRGLNPVPGAYSYLEGKRIKIFRSRVVELDFRNEEPGRILLKDKGMVVACGKGSLSILKLQMEGRRIVDIKAYLAGHRLRDGMRFISPLAI